jgi:hypothetical protein
MGGRFPIRWETYRRWAEAHGIDGHDFWIFRQLMSEIDDEWLAYEAERDKEREALRKTKSPSS